MQEVVIAVAQSSVTTLIDDAAVPLVFYSFAHSELERRTCESIQAVLAPKELHDFSRWMAFIRFHAKRIARNAHLHDRRKLPQISVEAYTQSTERTKSQGICNITSELVSFSPCCFCRVFFEDAEYFRSESFHFVDED